MAYDLTWSFNLNQVPALQDTLQHQAQNALYFFKTNLLTAGWTVIASCDGTTADATDRWTSANMVWNTSSTARSWITLASPVGFVAGADGSYTGTQSKLWMTIDCQGANSTAYNFWKVSIHSAAPTGGTTTATPTTANTAGITQQQFMRSSNNASKFHFSYTSNGGFWFGVSENSQGYMGNLVSFLPLVDVNLYGSIPYPYAAIFNSVSYSGSYTMNYFTNNPLGFSHDGTVANAFALTWLGAIGTTQTTLGNINGVIETTPGYIINTTTSKTFFVGRIPDFLSSAAAAPTGGSTTPFSGTPDHVVSNGLWLPANASLSL